MSSRTWRLEVRDATILYVTAGKSIFTIPLTISGYTLEFSPVP